MGVIENWRKIIKITFIVIFKLTLNNDYWSFLKEKSCRVIFMTMNKIRTSNQNECIFDSKHCIHLLWCPAFRRYSLSVETNGALAKHIIMKELSLAEVKNFRKLYNFFFIKTNNMDSIHRQCNYNLISWHTNLKYVFGES